MPIPGPMVSIHRSVGAVLTTVLLAGATALALTPLGDAARQPYIDAFVAKQQQTQTYEAELHQTLQLSGLKKPIESVARVYYKAPDSMRLSFTSPAGEYLIITGDDVYLKKTNRPLVHRKNASQKGRPGQDARMLLTLFQGGAKDWGVLFAFDMARDDDRLIVTLHPKQGDAQAHPFTIENVLALPSYELQSITISFGQDNAMTYEFTDPKRNGPIDDTVFVPPESDRKL
jgi:outer membrane lipoprotein-sorting protein